MTLNLSQSLQPAARQARIVFTPLHGTADSTVGAVLRKAGFEVHVVAEQAAPDGGFPAVPFRAPNPEVPQAMEMGVTLAQKSSGPTSYWPATPMPTVSAPARAPMKALCRFLTGNEIAVLVAHYKLEQLQRLRRLPAPTVGDQDRSYDRTPAPRHR